MRKDVLLMATATIYGERQEVHEDVLLMATSQIHDKGRRSMRMLYLWQHLPYMVRGWRSMMVFY